MPCCEQDAPLICEPFFCQMQQSIYHLEVGVESLL